MGSVGALFGSSMGMILPFFRCVDYCMVKDASEGPHGNRPKVFQVPVGCAIGACGSCRFDAVQCCFGYVGVERRGSIGERP